jgi:hypothetical protein
MTKKQFAHFKEAIKTTTLESSNILTVVSLSSNIKIPIY